VVAVDPPSSSAAAEGSVEQAETPIIQDADLSTQASATPGQGEGDGAAEAVLDCPVNAVHGVLHKLCAVDMAMLMNMEHEYW